VCWQAVCGVLLWDARGNDRDRCEPRDVLTAFFA
jgi:hypothetical protein